MEPISKIVSLRDNKELALALALEVNSKRPLGNSHHYREEYIKESVEELAKYNLIYNAKNGITFLNGKWDGCYTTSPPVYNSIEEVVRWEFVNYIMNGASRLSRGYEAVGR